MQGDQRVCVCFLFFPPTLLSTLKVESVPHVLLYNTTRLLCIASLFGSYCLTLTAFSRVLLNLSVFIFHVVGFFLLFIAAVCFTEVPVNI